MPPRPTEEATSPKAALGRRALGLGHAMSRGAARIGIRTKSARVAVASVPARPPSAHAGTRETRTERADRANRLRRTEAVRPRVLRLSRMVARSRQAPPSSSIRGSQSWSCRPAGRVVTAWSASSAKGAPRVGIGDSKATGSIRRPAS